MVISITERSNGYLTTVPTTHQESPNNDYLSLPQLRSAVPSTDQQSFTITMPVCHVVAFYILRGSKDVKFSWYCSLLVILIPWNVFLLFKPRPLRTAVQGCHFKESSVQFASFQVPTPRLIVKNKKVSRRSRSRNGYMWNFSQGVWHWLDSKCNFHEVTEVSVFSHTWRQVRVKFSRDLWPI